MQKSLVLLLLIFFACSEHKTPSPPPPGVTEFVIKPETIPAIFNFIGFAQSSHPVEIRARVEGYLDKIAYIEGQLVHEGDLLFQLDPRPYQAKVEESKGEVARNAAQVTNAQLTVDRLTPLYEKKAASRKDLDNATAGLLSSQASLLSAQAQLLYNQINLDYTTIRSPITGLTDKAKFREGALINPGTNSLMTTVSVIDPIWVYFTVSDNDILKSQQQVASHQMTLPSEREIVLPRDNKYTLEAIMSDDSVFPHKGIVDYTSPTYDQATGTLQVRGVFPNPEGNLRPGQFVRIKVYGAERPNAIFVPQSALMQESNGMSVYIIRDGKASKQPVSTGDWYGNYVIITNGLKAGDHIIVDGINKIRPGSPVTVLKEWTPDFDLSPTSPTGAK